MDNVDKMMQQINWSWMMELSRDIRTTLTALLTTFIVLKLKGLLAWSWWWVLAPIWIPLAITLIAIFMVMILPNNPGG